MKIRQYHRTARAYTSPLIDAPYLIHRLLSLMISVSLLNGCGGAPSPSLGVGPRASQGEESPSRLTAAQVAQLSSAEIVLIGETHDHPQHHLIQAEVIRAIKPKVVAFEMLDQRHQALLDQLDELPSETWDQALDWTKRGWPDFELYRPVFDAAIEVKAKLLGAHPTPQVIHPLKLGGELDATLRARLGLDTPLPTEQREALAVIIRESHCGYANAQMTEAMIKAQRLKDAWMSAELIKASSPAVLIVGRGHLHPQRGIPWALKLLAPQREMSVVSLALSPHSAKAERSQTDSRANPTVTELKISVRAHRHDDPCERFREQLKKLKHPSPKGGK